MDVKQQIKERLSIVDIVSQYVSLKNAGVNYVGLSPFTNEKTPSFYVSPDRGLYYCFSTSQGGDIFTFVQKMEGLDFRGALKLLADKAGISLHSNHKKDFERREILFQVMESAAVFFQEKLSRSPKSQKYLQERGVTQKILDNFRVGFAPHSWRDLYEYLHAKGFSDDIIVSVGLVKKTEKGCYDKFRSRIMFPILDSSGRVIAFSGRLFFENESLVTETDKKSAKYLNSPDTELFNKSDVFFGLYQAKDSIKKYNFVILVEGQFDLLLLHQIGYTNTVAASGTALTDKAVNVKGLTSHMGIVKRLTNNIILAYDADRAGLNAARKAARIALSLGMQTKVIQINEGLDPADFVLKYGKDAWKENLKKSVSLIEFLLERIIRNQSDALKIAQEIKEVILPEISVLPSAIDQDYFVKLISEKTNISLSALSHDLQKLRNKNIANKATTKEPGFAQVDAGDDFQKKQKTFPKSISNMFGLLWYIEEKHQNLFSSLDLFIKKYSAGLYDTWLEQCELDKDKILFEVEIMMTQNNMHTASDEVMSEFIISFILDFLRILTKEYKQTISKLQYINDTSKSESVMRIFTHIITMIDNSDILKKELYGTKKNNN